VCLGKRPFFFIVEENLHYFSYQHTRYNEIVMHIGYDFVVLYITLRSPEIKQVRIK
jgi:hypothetical protein